MELNGQADVYNVYIHDRLGERHADVHTCRRTHMQTYTPADRHACIQTHIQKGVLDR